MSPVFVKKDPAQAVLTERLTANKKQTRARWIFVLLFSVALLLLPWLVKLDGKPHADWQQFLGRFHPLAVHLPIGLLVLVPILEVVGVTRPALREAAGFVLGLTFLASCLGSLTLGYLLAYGSGESGATVTYHMWGGIALTIGVLFSVLLRPAWTSGSLTFAYPLLLVCALLMLVWTAHQGGSITHGSNYLTAVHAPFSQAPSAVPCSASLQSHFVLRQTHQPDLRCQLRFLPWRIEDLRWIAPGLLRSVDARRKGWRGIVPGNPDKSLLLYRVTLPPSHKQFMPAEGKPPLRAEEIAWIKAWIQQGASPTACHRRRRIDPRSRNRMHRCILSATTVRLCPKFSRWRRARARS